MSEEAKKAIEELVKATEGNDLAKAFLRGYKSGLDTAKADDGEKETRPAKGGRKESQLSNHMGR